MRDRFKFLRRPAKGDEPARKRNKSSSDIDASGLISDDALQIKLAYLKRECEKKKRDRSIATIQQLNTDTYGNRRKWIQAERPLVCEILTKYPSLKIRKIVSLLLMFFEFTMLFYTVKARI